MRFNDTLALLYEDAMRLYFKATIVDLHDLLQQAWTSLLSAYYLDHRIDKATFEALKDQLTSFPEFKDPVSGKMTKFTMEYAIRVDKMVLKDPALMDKLMNAWRAAARAKYLGVLRALGG